MKNLILIFLFLFICGFVKIIPVHSQAGAGSPVSANASVEAAKSIVSTIDSLIDAQNKDEVLVLRKELKSSIKKLKKVNKEIKKVLTLKVKELLFFVQISDFNAAKTTIIEMKDLLDSV